MTKKSTVLPVFFSAMFFPVSWAETETYDTHFMFGGLKGEKISHYKINADIPEPGIYEMDIYLNNTWRGRHEINIQQNIDNTCLTLEKLNDIGIRTETIQEKQNSECIPLRIAVQGGSINYDIGQFILNLTVPQAWINEREPGYMPPETWDRGINALYTSWYASQYYSDHKKGGNDRNSYLSLRSGLNFSGWQLHSDTNYSESKDSSGKWKSNTLYLERGIPEITGTFRAGEMYTGTELFDSIRFRGVRLWRDMHMLPDSQQNFTPIVRGIAQSQSLVTIEQNGFIVYQKEVTPGPFAIADLQLAGGGADLNVSVMEADGSISKYIVPFSSLPNMLQPGVSKYDISAGQSYIEGSTTQIDFLQAGYQRGVSNLLTVYGGTILADHYRAFMVGTGLNTSAGAFSFDATQSYSKQDNSDKYSGKSYQVAWNKYISQTETHFALAAWRYSSRYYRTFNDFVRGYNTSYSYNEASEDTEIAHWSDTARKNNFTVNINQTLPNGYGYISASGIWRNYWNKKGSGKDYQLSYTGVMNRFSYTVAASQTRNENDREDKRINIYVSVPLTWGDGFSAARRHYHLSNSTTFDKGGYQSNNTSLSGITGRHDQLSFNANMTHQRNNNETAAGGSITMRTSLATIGTSYSQSDRYRQVGANVQGGLVAWSEGIQFTNRLSDTFAIIKAPGLEGAAVQGHRYLTTDKNGFAVYDSLIPYRENHLTLDISHTDSKVALKGNRRSTVPYRGAVVLSEFDTDRRQPWYFLAKKQDGSPLTFGYEVEDYSGRNIGIVGQGSRIFIRTDSTPSHIKIATDKQQGHFCTITFGKTIDSNTTYICR